METIITTPSSCELRAVIRFLHAEGQSMAEIHHRVCFVHIYGDNVTSDSCMREWCRKFRDGHPDVHDVGQGRISIVTYELVQKVDQCCVWKTSFHDIRTFEELPQTSRTTLY
jgi:hypothetical protein